VTRVAPLFFKARFVGACLRTQMQHTHLFLFLLSSLVTITLVTGIGQDGQPMAHAPIFVHWMIQVTHLCDRNKAREQTSIFYRVFVSYKSIVSCLLTFWNNLVMMFRKKKTSHL